MESPSSYLFQCYASNTTSSKYELSDIAIRDSSIGFLTIRSENTNLGAVVDVSNVTASNVTFNNFIWIQNIENSMKDITITNANSTGTAIIVMQETGLFFSFFNF